MELYRALQGGKRDDIALARDHVRAAFEFSLRGPMPEMLMGGSQDVHRLIRHMPEFLDHFMERLLIPEEHVPKPKIKKDERQKPTE